MILALSSSEERSFHINDNHSPTFTIVNSVYECNIDLVKHARLIFVFQSYLELDIDMRM